MTADYALIVINWRTPALTVAAVRSAHAVGAPGRALRTVVVDNASGDDSLDVFRRELPEAEVVAMPENSGFARAVNAGLRRCDERIVFILNSDIEFRNPALDLLRAALDADKEAVLACPKLLRPDGSRQAAAVPEPRLFWELTNRSLPRRLLRVPQDRVSVVPSIVGPCMALDRDRLGPLAALDERFFFFFEETDWCRRIRQAGLHALYVPAAEVVHLQGESANRRPYRARVQFHLSRYKYFRKHGGRAAVVLLFTGLLLKLTVNVLLYSLLVILSLGRRRFRDKLAVYAMLWCWHMLLCRPDWGFEKRQARPGRAS